MLVNSCIAFVNPSSLTSKSVTNSLHSYQEGETTRRTFIFKMNVDIIRSLMMLALKKNMTATALLEEAVIRLLKENKKL